MEQTIACRQWSQFLQSASPVEKDKTKTHEISFSTDFVPVWLKEINFCKLWSDVMCVRGLHDNWKPSKTSLLFWGLLFSWNDRSSNSFTVNLPGKALVTCSLKLRNTDSSESSDFQIFFASYCVSALRNILFSVLSPNYETKQEKLGLFSVLWGAGQGGPPAHKRKRQPFWANFVTGTVGSIYYCN